MGRGGLVAWDRPRSGVACAREGVNGLVAFDDEPLGATLDRDIYGQLWGNRIYMPLVLR
jgi:hypothetical protein